MFRIFSFFRYIDHFWWTVRAGRFAQPGT